MAPKILYVEDNDDIREVTSRILTRAGYSVTPVANGVEALETYSRNRRNFELIITDIFMPLMNGNQFIKKLGELENTIPILVLTYSISDITPDPLVTVIATKPLTSYDLGNFVSEALSKANGCWQLCAVAS